MSDRLDVFMRDTDAFSWYLEKDPGLRATITAVTWLDRSPDFDALSAKTRPGNRAGPSLPPAPGRPPGRLANPRWIETDFDLSLHLRRMDAPAPHTPATVLDFARHEAMTGFDRSRPLWQFTLIEHLNGGGAALVMKVHHSLTDGIGACSWPFCCSRPPRSPRPLKTHHCPRGMSHVPSTAELVRESLAYDWHRVFGTLRHGISGAIPAGAPCRPAIHCGPPLRPWPPHARSLTLWRRSTRRCHRR